MLPVQLSNYHVHITCTLCLLELCLIEVVLKYFTVDTKQKVFVKLLSYLMLDAVGERRAASRWALSGY